MHTMTQPSPAVSDRMSYSGSEKFTHPVKMSAFCGVKKMTPR